MFLFPDPDSAIVSLCYDKSIKSKQRLALSPLLTRPLLRLSLTGVSYLDLVPRSRTHTALSCTHTALSCTHTALSSCSIMLYLALYSTRGVGGLLARACDWRLRYEIPSRHVQVEVEESAVQVYIKVDFRSLDFKNPRLLHSGGGREDARAACQ